MHLFYTGHKHYTQFSTNILILTIFITQSLSRYILFVRPNLSDQRHTTHLLAFSFCHKYFSCIHILKTLGHLENRAHIRSLADFGQTPRLEFYFNLWLTSSRWFLGGKELWGQRPTLFLVQLNLSLLGLRCFAKGHIVLAVDSKVWDQTWTTRFQSKCGNVGHEVTECYQIWIALVKIILF